LGRGWIWNVISSNIGGSRIRLLREGSGTYSRDNSTYSSKRYREKGNSAVSAAQCTKEGRQRIGPKYSSADGSSRAPRSKGSRSGPATEGILNSCKKRAGDRLRKRIAIASTNDCVVRKSADLLLRYGKREKEKSKRAST